AKAVTFKQCAETYIASHRAGWRNKKHAGQWQATLAPTPSPDRGFAGGRGRHATRAQDLGADLDDQAGDGRSLARSHRSYIGLRQGARLSRRREPRALAQPPRQVATRALYGESGPAP